RDQRPLLVRGDAGRHVQGPCRQHYHARPRIGQRPAIAYLGDMNDVVANLPAVITDHRPAKHPQVAAGRVGVLLVNLGTPEATDASAVRKYLGGFLSDRRVIEETGIVWQLVLHGIILPFRPRRKGRDYEKIWNKELNESPLKTITRAQAEKLATALQPL